jgi:serine/threonine protein kinase
VFGRVSSVGSHLRPQRDRLRVAGTDLAITQHRSCEYRSSNGHIAKFRAVTRRVNTSRSIIPPQMAVAPGTRVGPYEILVAIGAGGMGAVYRARDAKLGRDIAPKVLPEAFARDAERMARFQREAKVLASFNHSNIASIYGLEDAWMGSPAAQGAGSSANVPAASSTGGAR